MLLKRETFNILFLCEDKDICRFSDLHWCTFNALDEDENGNIVVKITIHNNTKHRITLNAKNTDHQGTKPCQEQNPSKYLAGL